MMGSASSPSTRSTTRPRAWPIRYGFAPSTIEIATRGSASRLRALRDPGCVKNTSRSPSRSIQTGTECGPPSGRTVATWAKLRPARSARRSSGNSAMPAIVSGHDQHVELARAVHALDAVELDVRGGGRPRDERDRTAGARGVAEPLDRIRDARDHVGGLDEADVVVGDERERAAPRAPAAVERDRPRLGDRQGAAREHAVDRVERPRRERRIVLDELDALDRGLGAE